MKGLVETKIWGLPVVFFIMIGISATMFASYYAPKMWDIYVGNTNGKSQPSII
jgi:hypothetical protein